MQKISRQIVCFALFVGITAVRLGFASELRPLMIPEVPQEVAPPPQQNKSFQQHLGEVDPSVFDAFRERVKILLANEKEAWIDKFEQRLDSAAQAKQWAQVQYYSKLLQILKGVE